MYVSEIRAEADPNDQKTQYLLRVIDGLVAAIQAPGAQKTLHREYKQCELDDYEESCQSNFLYKFELADLELKLNGVKDF